MENKLRKKILITAIGLALVIGFGYLLSSRQAVAPGPDDRLQVVTSFYPLYFFANEIAGDVASVHNITPAGAEPHEYEPTTQDMVKIQKSDLLILNGAGLESWGQRVQAELDPDTTVVVSVGETLATLEFMDDGAMAQDPHVWLSPRFAHEEVRVIRDSFMAADPEQADSYAASAERLFRQLDELHTAYQEGLRGCKRRDIVTSHNAFGYLANEYALKQVPIAGLSPDAEPSARQLAEVVAFVKNNTVTHIFFESLVAPDLAETIAKEAGAETLVLNPLEGLGEEEIAAGKNYFTEMRQNLVNLRIALQCQ